jgi:hypothetical protein
VLESLLASTIPLSTRQHSPIWRDCGVRDMITQGADKERPSPFILHHVLHDQSEAPTWGLGTAPLHLCARDQMRRAATTSTVVSNATVL